MSNYTSRTQEQDTKQPPNIVYELPKHKNKQSVIYLIIV